MGFSRRVAVEEEMVPQVSRAPSGSGTGYPLHLEFSFFNQLIPIHEQVFLTFLSVSLFINEDNNHACLTEFSGGLDLLICVKHLKNVSVTAK